MTRDEAIEAAKLLQELIKVQEISIILNTFVKSFADKSIDHLDGRYYLHGNFKITGTVSGRMASNSPNMQNIPSTGSKYAKLVKECFRAPDGWLLLGADFSSLEDKISALTTKDPNKLKVYTDGYDGHSLRAFSYFGSDMPGITLSVDSINTIQATYPKLRQKSKGPTFALTYGGTHYALINQCGLPMDEALQVEEQYHILYKVSDEWVAAKIDQAAKDGYVTVAFGLRVRTPILPQTILKKTNTPYAASAEARTAGNALGQSYGLLNNRAGLEMEHRIQRERLQEFIFPVAHIHDSQYFLVKDKVGLVEWFNDNLVECMQWQDLPELAHDEVKLGGEVDIHYESWAMPITIPNRASKNEILNLCAEGKYKYSTALATPGGT